MARYRKRRYYRKKGNWSANIKKISHVNLQAPTNSWAFNTILASNPVQSEASVSQIFTVKNVEFTFQIENTTTKGQYVEGITVYIMFVPQGMTVDVGYPQDHPEYIMAYRFIGSSETESTNNNNGVRNPLRVKTRLARKLNTGDKIVAFFDGYNSSSETVNFEVNGILRWWSKAN